MIDVDLGLLDMEGMHRASNLDEGAVELLSCVVIKRGTRLLIDEPQLHGGVIPVGDGIVVGDVGIVPWKIAPSGFLAITDDSVIR